MPSPAPPKITGVDVVTAKPTEAASAAITRLSAETNRSLPQVPYTVRVQIKTKPPVTSMAWALYVNGVLIPKYWEYEDGIYFTVLDPQFFSDHKGEPLRFSQNGIDFFDTGMKLPAAPAAPSESKGKATRSTKGKATRPTKGKAAPSTKGKATRPTKGKAARSTKGKTARSTKGKTKAARSTKGKAARSTKGRPR